MEPYEHPHEKITTYIAVTKKDVEAVNDFVNSFDGEDDWTSYDTEHYLLAPEATINEEGEEEEGEVEHEIADDRSTYGKALIFCAQVTVRTADRRLHRFFVHNYGPCLGNLQYLEPWLRNPKVKKLAHNVSADFHATMNEGIRPQGLKYDTMVMLHAVNVNLAKSNGGPGFGLKAASQIYLGKKRKSFKQTFGTLKRKKDGTPYANAQYEVVPLPQYVPEELPEPPQFAELVHRAAIERKDHARAKAAWAAAGGVAEAYPDCDGPYTRWLTLIEYALADTDDALQLCEIFQAKLKERPWIAGKTQWDNYIANEVPLTEEICDMERRGMPLDVELLQIRAKQAAKDMEECEARIVDWVGQPINVRSNKQMGQFLFGAGQIPINKKNSKKVAFYIQGQELPVLTKTRTEQPSMTGDAIKKLIRWAKQSGAEDTEEGKQLLSGLADMRRHSAIKTQRKTFLDGMLEKQHDCVLHCRVVQTGAVSGRWSSAGPNLMNITTGDKDVYTVRSCFVAPPGYVLIISDFSQLEYRLMAHTTNDETMIALFDQGWDMHSLTTFNVNPDIKREALAKFKTDKFNNEIGAWVAENYPDHRKRGKTVNFEVIYGVGPKKLSEQLEITKDEAWAMIEGWFRQFPRVRPWQQQQLALARSGQPVRTIGGRLLYPDMKKLNSSEKWLRGEEERSLLNGIVQGSAADVTKRGMNKLRTNEELKKLGYRMIMQVHDEVDGYAPRATAQACVPIMKPLLENPYTSPLRLALPVAIGIGPDWASAKC